MFIDEITRRDLEFDFIIETLKGFAQTSGGREYFDNPDFYEDKIEIEREYQIVSEAVSIINKNEDIHLGSLYDIREHILRIKKGGIISGPQILEIKNLIMLVRQFRSFIRSRREDYPLLYEKTANLERYDDLFASINKIIDDKGVIRDDCSDKLTELRLEAKRIRERIINYIDNFLIDPDNSKFLMDSYYSIRNNRYVLPIKTQHKNNVKGIIHGSSNTGETLFIEPESIINLDNELVYAESRVVNEEENILKGLSQKINEYSDMLKRDYEILISIDVLFSKARYSIKLDGRSLRIGNSINLLDICHPILVLKNTKVVPNSISLENGVRGVVISGPNAGGKTVLLKTIGLALLHLKMGLFFSVYEKSHIISLKRIFTCFGDAQNLEEGLSTFTGHIKRLKYILDNCDKDDLILLDEIASDTDPKEGSALSASIIEGMIKKGAYVFVTTHFHELRYWAANRKDIINAAMGFDPIKLKPTYKLLMGVSGESYTLRIAKEMGIPDSIIENAEEILGKDYREYSEMSNLLKAKEKELSLKIEELEKIKSSYDRQYNELVEKKEKEYEKKIDELNRERERILSEMETFYNKVSAEISRIQKESDMKSAVLLQKEIKNFTDKNKHNNLKLENEISFKIGDNVFVNRFKSSGIILEVDEKKNRYLININGKNIWVYGSDISLQNVSKDLHQQIPIKINEDNMAEDKNIYKGGVIEYQKEIDVRGLYLDDALSEIEKELDFCYRKSYSRVKIIHGHGTGSLKIGIRKYLRNSIYVSAFRPAELNDGGDGVTIVEIKND